MKNSALVSVVLLSVILTGISIQPTFAAGCADPEFAAARAFTSHANPWALCVGDFNGDSNTDVVAASYTSNIVSVLFGKGDGTLQTNVDYGGADDVDTILWTDLNADGKKDLVLYSSGLEKVSVLLGNGDGTFGTNINLTGLGGYAFAVGDLNGDGTNDVVIGGSPISSVRLGTGNLTFGTNYNFTTGEAAVSIAIGDVNADGIPDIVVGNTAANVAHLTVLLGHGDGTFANPTNTEATANNSAVAIGDFNGDGTNDVAVFNSTLGLVSIFLSNGDGTFHIKDFKTTGNPGPVVSSLRVMDVNGDGKLDVVVGDFQIFVFLGNGDGTLQPAVKYDQPAIKVDIGDFNGDGISDLFAASAGLEGTPNLRLLLGNGDGTFQEPPHYRTGSNPLRPVAADFNGDGKLDLAISNSGTNTISILLNKGDGTYGTNFDYFVGQAPQSIAVGDFNGDGKLDLAVANLNTNYVSVLLGNGNGTFQTNVQVHVLPFFIGAGFVLADDFNGDGKVDLAVPGLFGLSFLAGNGNGTFKTNVDSSAAFAFDKAVTADVNKDGKLDIVVGNFGTTNVTVLLGNGNGTFQPPRTNFAGTAVYDVAVGDVNGDGKPDIIVADFGCNPCNTAYPHGKVQVLLGNGNGTFQPAVGYLVDESVGSYSVALADVNGDGKLDIIVGSNSSPVTWVLLNKGDGTFQRGIPFGTDGGIGLVSVGDVDGDGHPDVLVGNQSVNSVSVLLNTCPLGGSAGGVAISLTPALATNTVSTAHTVTATVTSNSVAKAGAVVNFSVTAGPNLGQTGTATTSPSGQGSFTYTGSAMPGTDTIQAISLGATGTATEVWIASAAKRDLAVAQMKAPKKITLTAKKPNVTGKFAVTIQNDGDQPEVIPDLGTLANLVTLHVQSLGLCANPSAVLTTPKFTFPVTLKPKKKLNLAYTAIFSCANDPLATTKTAAHNDYQITAAADITVLGETDSVPANDDCPHTPFGADKGCGGKPLGSAVFVDVVQK